MVFSRSGRVVLTSLVIGLLALLLGAGPAAGQVQDEQKISETAGNLSGTLDDGDRFGSSITHLGDVDGDGIDDLAVGAPRDEQDVCCSGAVWILLMNQDGTVKRDQKITDTEGGFTGPLNDDDFFGTSVTALGDLDGNGVPDLAVGAERDDDGGRVYNSPDYGAVWILFLKDDGTVLNQSKISADAGGFSGTLSRYDRFGSGLATVGDLDGNGTVDLAVGAKHDDTGSADDFADRGAVWILFLNSDASVGNSLKIASNQNGFNHTLDDGTQFGTSVDGLGDLDGNGTNDLVVGTDSTFGADYPQGAAWILQMKSDGTVQAAQRIAQGQGGFTGDLGDQDAFGASVAGVGDLNDDGTPDALIGAPFDEDDGIGGGAAWITYLSPAGTVLDQQKISNTAGGFSGQIRAGERFGSGTAPVGDLDGDGATDLAVGSPYDLDGSGGTTAGGGALWVLFGDATALPVELSHLDATAMDRTTVRLAWQTASEQDNAGFRVQRERKDGTWATLGRRDGAGTTQTPQRYRFTDRDVPVARDVLRYRLQQVDLDGSVHLSKTVSVRRPAVRRVAMQAPYPNPASEHITVPVAIPEDAAVEVHLFDLLGRAVQAPVRTPTRGRGEIHLDVSSLASGPYVLRLQAGGEVRTRRVTVVR